MMSKEYDASRRMTSCQRASRPRTLNERTSNGAENEEELQIENDFQLERHDDRSGWNSHSARIAEKSEASKCESDLIALSRNESRLTREEIGVQQKKGTARGDRVIVKELYLLRPWTLEHGIVRIGIVNRRPAFFPLHLCSIGTWRGASLQSPGE